MKTTSEEIAKMTQDFFARGGVVSQVNYDMSAERAALVGQWSRLGDPISDDVTRDEYWYDFEPADSAADHNAEAFRDAARDYGNTEGFDEPDLDYCD